MSATPHPAAPHHLPSFITAPGETDVLMVVSAIILIAAIAAFGTLFLRLHTLPERMAHGSLKLQFEIVAVLGLLALFTHQHIFWVAGLLLALVDLPDFGTPPRRIAGSLESMAKIAPGAGATLLPTRQNGAAFLPSNTVIDRCLSSFFARCVYDCARTTFTGAIGRASASDTRSRCTPCGSSCAGASSAV